MRYEVIYLEGKKRVARVYDSEFVVDDETAQAHIARGVRVYNATLRPGETKRKALKFRWVDEWPKIKINA